MPAARDLFRLIVDAAGGMALGAEHPDTLAARAKLARWTGQAGDAGRGPGPVRRAAAHLRAGPRPRAPAHPDRPRQPRLLDRGRRGTAAGARDQYAALLPVHERVLGPEHPDTLAARANLASWTGEAGDAAGARDQFAALLPVHERVLGPETPST